MPDVDSSRAVDSDGTGAPAELEIDPAVIQAGCEILAENYMELVDVVDGTKERVVEEIIRAAARVHPGLIVAKAHDCHAS